MIVSPCRSPLHLSLCLLSLAVGCESSPITADASTAVTDGGLAPTVDASVPGADGGSDAPFDSGFEPDRAASSLSAAEASMWCDAALARRRQLLSDEEAVELNCLAIAIGQEEPAACEDRLARCLTLNDPVGREWGCDLADEDVRAECAAPIELLDDCIEGRLRLAAERSDYLSCEYAGRTGEVAARGELPESCDLVRDLCPDVWGAGGV